MSKPDFRKRDDNRPCWWLYTLELEHTGFVKQRIRDHPDAPPFGEKRGETKQERRGRAWKAECHKMPQKRVKYYMGPVALIGQVRWHTGREAL